MEDTKFPKLKDVVVKRTKNGHRYLLHGKDSCGKDVYVTIPVTDKDTEKDYFAKIRDARIKLNAKKTGESIDGFISEYAAKRQLASGTINALKRALRNFSLDNDNNIKCVQKIIDRGYKQSTLRSMVGYVGCFFRWLILTKKIEGIIDPTAGFVVKHSKFARSRTFTDKEEKKFLEKVKQLKNLELRLFLQLAYYTGARASSIYVLERNSIRDNKVYYYNVKSRRNYEYPVPLYDQDTIDLFNSLYDRGFLFSEPLLHYQTTAWQWFQRHFGRDENDETLSLHSLRHNFATKMIQNGISPEVVSRLLDHSSPAITLKFYAKHSEQQLEEAIDKIFKK